MAQASSSLEDRARAVLAFWFGERYDSMPFGGMVAPEVQKNWFRGGPDFDKAVATTFSADLDVMAAGKYDEWLTSSNVYNGLAGVILADQLTRNAYRGTTKVYEMDAKARAWASHLLDAGRSDSVPPAFRAFLIIPFMHSETLEDLQHCVTAGAAALAAAEALASPAAEPGMLEWLRSSHQYGIAHRDVIQRWGRYPHRNTFLGRPDTAEEAAGLADGSIPRY